MLTLTDEKELSIGPLSRNLLIQIKSRPDSIGTAQFGVILQQPAAGQAKEKFFLSTNFSSAAGETE